MNQNISIGPNLIRRIPWVPVLLTWTIISCSSLTNVGNAPVSLLKYPRDSVVSRTINHYKSEDIKHQTIPHTFMVERWMSPSEIHRHVLKLSRQQWRLESNESGSRKVSFIWTTWTNPTTNQPVSRGYTKPKTGTVGNTIQY